MNYRNNQSMNTTMNHRGMARRRPIRPDFESDRCDTPITPPSDSCGCEASITPPSDSCGCETPITPPSNSCGCETPITPPSDSCGCETPITPPSGSCGCEASITPPSGSCGCGTSSMNRPNRPLFSGINSCPISPSFPPELLYCSNPAATDQLNGMPLAMAYVPWQSYENLYCAAEGFHKGTIFKDLNYEFLGRRCN